MKAVVFYESGAGLAEKAPLHMAAHREWNGALVPGQGPNPARSG
jgi:hypothetical protein